MREKFIIKPVEHILDVSRPPLNASPDFASWPSMNVMIDQHRVKKRYGYQADRTIPNTQHTLVFERGDGTQNVLYLTTSDLGLRKTGSGETYSFLTDTYTTGTISSITGTAVVGSGTTWSTNVAAGDYFIMDDDHSSSVETDANWVTIASVTDDTHLTLSSSYTKNGTTYKIRKVYTTPTNERWQFAVVADTFCFTNGNTHVQKWTGSGYASDLDSTNASKARYCIEYANRLILGDTYISATREPWTIAYSKENDATDWTDSTAGSIDLMNTADKIMGFGKIGSSLAVFKEESIIWGHRTGQATDPLSFPRQNMGIGCAAPYSIVPAMGSVAFLGKDDFYWIEGDRPVPIGDRIRHEFFERVDDDYVKTVWGLSFQLNNECYWFADTKDGQIAFVWDYKDKEWYTYDFWDTIVGGGLGVF